MRITKLILKSPLRKKEGAKTVPVGNCFGNGAGAILENERPKQFPYRHILFFCETIPLGHWSTILWTVKQCSILFFECFIFNKAILLHSLWKITNLQDTGLAKVTVGWQCKVRELTLLLSTIFLCGFVKAKVFINFYGSV